MSNSLQHCLCRATGQRSDCARSAKIELITLQTSPAERAPADRQCSPQSKPHVHCQDSCRRASWVDPRHTAIGIPPCAEQPAVHLAPTWRSVSIRHCSHAVSSCDMHTQPDTPLCSCSMLAITCHRIVMLALDSIQKLLVLHVAVYNIKRKAELFNSS